jgi:hypothetical protein
MLYTGTASAIQRDDLTEGVYREAAVRSNQFPSPQIVVVTPDQLALNNLEKKTWITLFPLWKYYTND